MVKWDQSLGREGTADTNGVPPRLYVLGFFPSDVDAIFPSWCEALFSR